MLTEEARKWRIGRMIDAAKMYRGWSGTELACALGREPSRSVRATGNPKLDLVKRLADALDWETGDLAETLMHDEPEDSGGAFAGARFNELDERAQVAHRTGDFAEMESVARAMQRIARSPRERAIAANRLAGAHDGFGRYPRVLSCVQAGLSEGRIGEDIRIMLLVNLANANYTLWNLYEARSVSMALIERFDREPPRGRLERVAQAFSYAIRGHTGLRALSQSESDGEFARVAVEAEGDLGCAEQLYCRLAEEFGDPQYSGLANTARGGRLEARVAAGRMAAEEAMDQIVGLLDRALDPSRDDTPHLLESWGWWSVFGANIAMRTGHTRTTREGSDHVEQTIAICTNKAAEIAEELDLWPMRERAFTMEWCRRQEVSLAPDEAGDWMLDGDDVRILVGTMGRFPRFRPTGWAILEHAIIAGPAA